jgi:hypothetical protein
MVADKADLGRPETLDLSLNESFGKSKSKSHYKFREHTSPLTGHPGVLD